jgi:hypothetical protein
MLTLVRCRKSTECVIGILKARFWYMKNPLRLRFKEDIANVVYTCSVLHNMLLHFDGFDKLWTTEDWLMSDPVDSEEDEEVSAQKSVSAKKRRLIHPEKLQEYVIPEHKCDEATIIETKHTELRSKLVTNLKYLWDKGAVEHLRFPGTKATGIRD